MGFTIISFIITGWQFSEESVVVCVEISRENVACNNGAWFLLGCFFRYTEWALETSKSPYRTAK